MAACLERFRKGLTLSQKAIASGVKTGEIPRNTRLKTRLIVGPEDEHNMPMASGFFGARVQDVCRLGPYVVVLAVAYVVAVMLFGGSSLAGRTG